MRFEKFSQEQLDNSLVTAIQQCDVYRFNERADLVMNGLIRHVADVLDRPPDALRDVLDAQWDKTGKTVYQLVERALEDLQASDEEGYVCYQDSPFSDDPFIYGSRFNMKNQGVLDTSASYIILYVNLACPEATKWTKPYHIDDGRMESALMELAKAASFMPDVSQRTDLHISHRDEYMKIMSEDSI